MATSLGLNLSTIPTTKRPRINNAEPTTVVVETPCAPTTEKRSLVSVPKGFLPTLLFSSFFLVIPLLSEYMSYDYSTTEVRVGVIVVSAVGALLTLFANDCVAWFNMAFFFHIGIEVGVLDVVMDYAQADSTSTTGMVLAWVAFGVILVHLIPFLFVDHCGILTVLSFAGVLVNTSTLVYIDPSRLLLVGISSLGLLGLVLLIACIDGVRTSMLSQLRGAMRDGSWVICSPCEG